MVKKRERETRGKIDKEKMRILANKFQNPKIPFKTGGENTKIEGKDQEHQPIHPCWSSKRKEEGAPSTYLCFDKVLLRTVKEIPKPPYTDGPCPFHTTKTAESSRLSRNQKDIQMPFFISPLLSHLLKYKVKPYFMYPHNPSSINNLSTTSHQARVLIICTPLLRLFPTSIQLPPTPPIPSPLQVREKERKRQINNKQDIPTRKAL